MNAAPVTLQISLSPSDYAHARHLLAHQVRTWRHQVAEILLTIDLHRSRGRFSARWAEGREAIGPLARSISGVRVAEVDYSATAQSAVAAEFFTDRQLPAKDYRGGPYYSYFFALHAAANDLVLHADSDMFFGGGSRDWLSEALARLDGQPDILIIAPLPGPPAPDGALRQLKGTRREGDSLAFDFAEMSTRLFLLDRRRFHTDFGRLSVRRPGWRQRLQAWLDGNPATELPENLFTARMRERGLRRHEFLGSAPGMWSLHPPYRSADFYRRLPELITRVESGDVPAAQQGDHDMNGSMVDWSEGLVGLRANRWWRRLGRRVRRLVAGRDLALP